MDGLLLIDKPAGSSSAQVIARLKRLLNLRKMGHAGTLDPFATGLLIGCLNQGTKLARFFLGGDKRYQAQMVLGVETDTQDMTGKVTATHTVPDIPQIAIAAVCQSFIGDIEQAPPVYSALKHQGVALYKLARAGRPVQKAPRPVRILSLVLTDIRLPVVEFTVHCSAGTYIRTLCADIGRTLGCGAHLAGLRRTQSSAFTVQAAATLPELEALKQEDRWRERLVAPADALQSLPTVVADEGLVKHLSHGRPVVRSDLSPAGLPESGWLKIVDGQNRLHAVLEAAAGQEVLTYLTVFN